MASLVLLEEGRSKRVAKSMAIATEHESKLIKLFENLNLLLETL